MIRLTIIAPFFLVALLGAWGAGATALWSETEPLPFMLEPLSWDMTQREFETKVGSKAIEINDHQSVSADGEALAASTAWSAEWGNFGKAHVSVAHDDSGRIHWLGVETTNLCDRYTVEIVGCWTGYHAVLTGLREALMPPTG